MATTTKIARPRPFEDYDPMTVTPEQVAAAIACPEAPRAPPDYDAIWSDPDHAARVILDALARQDRLGIKRAELTGPAPVIPKGYTPPESGAPTPTVARTKKSVKPASRPMPLLERSDTR